MIEKLMPYPAVARFLVLVAFALTLARACSYPFLARYLAQMHDLSPAVIGAFLGAGPLLGMLAGVWAGGLSDRYGRRPVLIGSSALLGLGFAGLAAGGGLGGVFASNILLSLAGAALEPVIRALIGDICAPDQRLKAFAHRYLMTNLGYGLGPLIGAFAGLAHLPVLFLVSAAGCGLTTVLFMLMLPAVRPVRAEGAVHHGGLRAGLALLRHDRRLLWFVGGGLLVALVMGQISVTLAQSMGEAVKVFAIVMSVNAVTVILASQPVARLMRGREPAQAFSFGALLLAVGAVGFAAAGNDLWFAGAAMIIFTLGEVLIVPAEYLLVEAIAPADRRGAYHGAQSLTVLGTAAGPLAGGWMLSAAGAPAPYLLFAVCALLAVLTIRHGRRQPPPPAREAAGEESSLHPERTSFNLRPACGQ